MNAGASVWLQPDANRPPEWGPEVIIARGADSTLRVETRSLGIGGLRDKSRSLRRPHDLDARAYNGKVSGKLRSGSLQTQPYWEAETMLFTGEQRDSDGRLYYLRARHYGPDNPKRTGSTIAEVSLALDFRCPAY